MSIGVAVIGAGLMGADHARRIERDIKGAHLAVLSDIDQMRATTVLESIQSSTAKYVADAAAAIEDDAVDAVIITAPDRFHVPLTLMALDAGKPVLCEKPLAPSANECLAVLEYEDSIRGTANTARVSLGFMRRFDPGCLELRHTVASNELGPALLVHCIHRNVRETPGGSSELTITAMAVHEFDFLPWLLDSPVRTVSWHAGKNSTRAQRRDPQLVLLETEDGVIATLELFVNAAYGYEVRCELVCETGSKELRSGAAVTNRISRNVGVSLPADSTGNYVEAYRSELQAWISSITAEGDPRDFGLASAWDGYVAAAVADAVLVSMQSGSGRVVDVATIEAPSLYV